MADEEVDPEWISELLHEVEEFTKKQIPVINFRFTVETLHMLDIALRLAYTGIIMVAYDEDTPEAARAMIIGDACFNHLEICESRDTILEFLSTMAQSIDTVFSDTDAMEDTFQDPKED